ncbi:MAG: serine/threonine protein kinase [Alphaproteobacteria bacterium]|nr:serine/threonine protein kinase [Alphaproteobacteria bacterium]
MAPRTKDALPRGHQFEGYRIEGVLGTGAFGITYRAREIELGRWVAIKEYFPRELVGRAKNGTTVRASHRDDSETYRFSIDCFRDEAKVLVNFDHPNIISVYRYFMANGTGYLVMPFAKGETLQDRLDRDRTMPEEDVTRLVLALLDGLEQVHEAGFLHRDIKPSNIFIQEDGTPVLIDFGASRQAVRDRRREAASPVTPGYSPFEQYSPKGRHGPWTDIYALGATLYHAISGAPPPDIFERIENDRMVPARELGRGLYRPTLLAAIDKALELSPHTRPPDVVSWRESIESRSRPVPSGDTGRTKRAGKDSDTIFASPAEAAIAAAAAVKTRRAGAPRRARWIAAALVLLIVAGVGAYFGPKLLDRQRAKQIAAARAKILGTWCFEKTRYLQVKISDDHIQMVNRRLNRSSNRFVYKAVKLVNGELTVRTSGRGTLGEASSRLVKVQVMTGVGEKAARLRWVPAKTVLNGREVEAGDPEILIPCGS